jgi:hypothetical protein
MHNVLTMHSKQYKNDNSAIAEFLLTLKGVSSCQILTIKKSKQ